MSRVLLFGSFDGFHLGHAHLLEEARKYGAVTVVLAQDDVIRRLKRHEPSQRFFDRKETLLSCGLVDKVVASDVTEGKYFSVQAEKPDVIIFGYDQEALRENFLAWQEKTGYPVKVLVLGAFEPERYKSSKMRQAAG